MKNKSFICIVAVSVSFVLASFFLSHHYVIQISSSLPCGVYKKKAISETILIGQIVLVVLSPEIRSFMINQQWIPAHLNYFLMKPVAARPGDHVRITPDAVYINHQYKGPVKQVDQEGKHLPHYLFDGILKKNTYFLLGTAQNSFDSRYFGPIHKQSIINSVEPFITFNFTEI
ncbi:MAG: S26 family signal peptidase [Candidatus Magnetomorum sp.]|nr:S26 family signal peptidase [Candidatus Magnetomorum sp.]